MNVYQTVIFYIPKDENGNKGEPEIIQDLKIEIVESEEKLRRKLIRSIPESYEDKIDEVQIVIIPLVGFNDKKPVNVDYWKQVSYKGDNTYTLNTC